MKAFRSLLERLRADNNRFYRSASAQSLIAINCDRDYWKVFRNVGLP